MDKPRPCGCKGCRTCLICENEHGIANKAFNTNKGNGTYIYCPHCNCAWPGWEINDWKTHPNHKGQSIPYPGIYIDLNFLSEEEEHRLITGIDSVPWDPSQSGRRKQNYGPKCNFRKRKLRVGDFKGFPQFSKFVQDKFQNVPILRRFQTIEQCSLEYDPQRGASIDPHVDDCWIWGDRVVSLNLLSDSVLTMTYNDKLSKYNLDCVGRYPETSNVEIINRKWPVIRIPMPKRSLLVMFDSARYDWEHQILREDITERRICLAYREFPPQYLLEGGDKFLEAKQILNIARSHYF